MRFDSDNPTKAIIDTFVQSGLFVVIGTGLLAIAPVALVVGGAAVIRAF